MVQMGYDREQIEQSLEMERYDEIWAAYHLLSLPVSAVSFFADCFLVIVVVIIYTLSRKKNETNMFFCNIFYRTRAILMTFGVSFPE